MTRVHGDLELAMVDVHQCGQVLQISVLTVVELVEKLQKERRWDGSIRPPDVGLGPVNVGRARAKAKG